MITRTIKDDIQRSLETVDKIILIFGARQVGKTTLIQEIIKTTDFNSLEINADEAKYIDVFSSRDLRKMMEVVGRHNLLFIDEAQNISNIGINLKILHDNQPNLKIIATGSSSFDLANKIIEPLTGRTRTYKLFPISMQELSNNCTPFELKERVEDFMLYGMYPDILNISYREEKIRTLRELATAYLYKDILQLSGIRYSDKIHKLLQLLALQIGNLVSLHELAKALEMSHETVSNYIDLLEKGFIVYRLSAYSKNMRKEITKMDKIYFYDLGIRNVLIENFSPLDLRQDKGQLWENFLITERLKKQQYRNIFFKAHFWRTYAGAEMDYVETEPNAIHGYEFKWKLKKRNAPLSWSQGYENTTFQQIHQDNFLDFVI